MQPLYDAMDVLAGRQSSKRELINKSVALAPLCYMRGRTSSTTTICIFDEAPERDVLTAQAVSQSVRGGHAGDRDRQTPKQGDPVLP
jgi:predicted ribonuclease YlaK